MDAATTTLNTVAEQTPVVAAIVVLVLIFLWYLDRKDRQFIDYLEQAGVERRADNERMVAALDNLSKGVTIVHADLKEMDTYLRANLDAMRKARASRRKDDPAV